MLKLEHLKKIVAKVQEGVKLTPSASSPEESNSNGETQPVDETEPLE